MSLILGQGNKIPHMPHGVAKKRKKKIISILSNNYIFQQINFRSPACIEGKKNNHLPHDTICLSLIFDSVYPAKQRLNTHQILESQ